MRFHWFVTARASLVVGILVGVVPDVAQAQVRAMTLDAYLAEVVAHAPSQRAAAARVDAARALTTVADRRLRPSLEVGLAALDVSGQGAPTSSLVGIGLPVELGGDRRARRDLADADVAVSVADAATNARDVALSAGLAFVDALEARAAEAVARDRVTRAERALVAERRRHELGEVGRLALHAAELEAFRARAFLERSRAYASARRMALVRWLPGEALAEVEPEGDLDVPSSPRDVDSLIADALSNRPEAERIRAALARAEADLELTRASRIGDALVRLGWTHNTRTDEPQFMQRANDLLSATLSLPVPSGLLRARPERSARAAIRDAADAEIDAVRIGIASEVRAAHAVAVAEREHALAIGGEVRTEALALFEAARQVYERNEGDLATFLAARAELERADMDAVIARAEAMRARLRLDVAVGMR